MAQRNGFREPADRPRGRLSSARGAASRDDWEATIRRLLVLIGEDPDREGLRRTPLRVKQALQFLTSGYHQQPSKVLVRAFSEVRHDEMVIVKDIDFYSMCVHGKSIVYTPDGYRFAGAIRPGDVLLTVDPVTRALETTEVLAVSVTKHRERFNVRFSNDRRLLLTGEHPVFVVEKGFVPARELRPGDAVLGAHGRSLTRPSYTCRFGYALGYVLGAVASDGSVDSGRRLRLEVNDREFATKFAEQSAVAFGIDTHVEPIRKPSGFLGRVVPQYRVRICSSFITEVVDTMLGGDKRCKTFRFPEVVLNDRDTMQGFLDGYVDGDGHQPNNHGYYTGDVITSANMSFLDRLGQLLETPVAHARDGTGRVYVSKRWFQARRTAKGTKRGFRPVVQGALLQQMLADAETRIYRVQSIERQTATLKSYTMYNFECAPYQSFLANGILVKNCEHHMLPFYGRCHIAYMPDKKIIGLSKIPRLVDAFARRLQVQERLTTQIAEALNENIRPRGVACVMEASHLCMMMRGVQKQNTRAVTSAMLGAFRTNEKTRTEFLALIRSHLS